MIKKLISSIQLTGRVLKNLLLQPFRLAKNKFTHLLSGGRAANALPGMVKKLPKLLKTKPEKAEDYFDWGTIYVAKSLVIAVVILLIIVPVAYIFLLHPLLTSWFWVKDFQTDAPALSSYSGRVRVYYDAEYENIRFEGRLSDGKPDGEGEVYSENGRIYYDGNFEDGVFSGEGILYYDDGSVKYRGSFSGGKFNGSGEYSAEDGKAYSGSFIDGKLQGSGSITSDGSLYYSGSFVDGEPEGTGKQYYPDGKIRYNGSFSDGVPHGQATEYTQDGLIKYNGMFTAGMYNGDGVLYDDNGVKIYSGSFEMGKYSGTGTLYNNGSKLYTGEFENGLYNGNGTLYSSDGSVTAGSFSDGKISGAATRTYTNGIKYEGCFEEELPHGAGFLGSSAGGFTYSGMFADGDFDYSRIIGAASDAVNDMMPSLVRRIDTDCFYLEDNDYGISVKFSFATESSAASAKEVFAKPFASLSIDTESDIKAPSALSVYSVNKALPSWAEIKYGISADSLKCFAAEYDTVTVYYWVDRSSGELLLKSAEGKAATRTDTPGNASDGELSYEEIKALFEELGLDIADFASLGFTEESFVG